MHELSVCMSILEQVEAIASERAATRVTGIELTIGPLSGVEAELLRNAYPIAAAGTVAEQAELVIRESDIIVCCGDCGAETTALANRLTCGDCGAWRTTVVSGDEMLLQRLELESA